MPLAKRVTSSTIPREEAQMTSILCVCGARVAATDGSEIFGALRRHTDEAHGDLGITDDQLRGLIERASMMNDWDGSSRPLPAPLHIYELTPDREKDFLAYFDREAFMDNSAWAGCYCFFYRFHGSQEEWQRRGWEENRAAQQAAIVEGSASGFLAYSGERVVAWCHAAPRGDLPLLDAGPTDEPKGKIASIVCFNVSPRHRHQGIARALLDTACASFAAKGYGAMEAYPVREFKTTAQAYHGSLQMFLDAGFTQVGEREPAVIVRKKFAV